MPISRLEYLADPLSRYEEHSDTPVGHYHYILRPKTSGGLRLIEAPKSQLKSAQRMILDRILSKAAVHADAFGFVKGRNCVRAASRHVGEQVVLSFDLQNSFPSVEAARVFGLFRCLGYPHAVARLLTGLCTTTTPVRILSGLDAAQRATHRRPHLPQGSPASPSLANLAAFPLDRRLSGMAKSLGMNYSRYADDLTFSGDRDATATMMRAVPEIIEDEGFRLNGAKTRVASRTCRQTVTGIIVNDRLNVDRRSFDHLKAVIHACGRPDDSRIDDADFRSSLLGKIAWVESIHPAKGQKLLDLLSTAIAKRTGDQKSNTRDCVPGT